MNVPQTLILPGVAEVLIHFLYAVVGYHVSGQKVVPELIEGQGHPGSILGTKGYITVPDFDSECCQFITSLYMQEEEMRRRPRNRSTFRHAIYYFNCGLSSSPSLSASSGSISA
ncbi:hypothetical protein [Cohnella sp.]|uniref:hypothetical protein n=1 Tax=Cohnella sp. TaxID=1883426 RepID=UPI0035653E0B